MKKKGFLLIFSCISIALFAQEININLPSKANVKYTLMLNKGIETDTIQQGRVNFAGGEIIRIPEIYAEYKGVGFIKFDNGETLNLIVSKEKISITEDEKGQYIFSGSPENEYLYEIIKTGKIGKSEPGLYAENFVNTLRYVGQLNSFLSTEGGSLADRNRLLDYAKSGINYDQLYTSGLWFYVIDGLFRLNEDQGEIGKDMILVLDKINTQKVYEYLVKNIITITQQYGLDNAFDIIISHVVDSDKIKVPTGDIYKAFNMVKVIKGKRAPVLVGLASADEKSYNKMLVIFYQSGCDNCEKEVELIKEAYTSLVKEGIRVVAVSGDEDKQEFLQKSKTFPWKDTLCDLDGFSGKNFMNYGIIATPTIYLIDKNWIVLERSASLATLNFK